VLVACWVSATLLSSRYSSLAREAGDAFYVPGGHLQRVEAGTEYLQFSPADELRVVSENIERNMRQMQGA
jgi:hypothetical protein